MKLNYDKQVDAIYLRLDDSKILDSEEVAPGIILDFNEKNQVVGVEMLSLSKRTGARVPDLVELTGLVPASSETAYCRTTESSPTYRIY